MMKELKTFVQDEIQQNENPPQLCVIRKIHTDGFIDIETNIGYLSHLECIGTPVLDKKGILFFIDNDTNQKIVVV